MDKAEAKRRLEMLAKAIDSLPGTANITDLYAWDEERQPVIYIDDGFRFLVKTAGKWCVIPTGAGGPFTFLLSTKIKGVEIRGRVKMGTKDWDAITRVVAEDARRHGILPPEDGREGPE